LEDPNGFTWRLELLKRAIGNGEDGQLNALNFALEDEFGESDSPPHPFHTTVSRVALREWAISRKERPPFLFPEDYEIKDQKNMLESCFNEKLKWHARELVIAIETWNHFYNKNHVNKNLGQHGKQIETWLKDNYKDDMKKDYLSGNGIIRIREMVNRFKKKEYKP